ncbi:MAG: STAS domain-containing protein [Acidimicrobiales bacterium]
MHRLRLTVRLTTVDTAVVSLDGEIDAHETVPLREMAASLLAAGVRHVTLDLAGVTFVDLGGMRALADFGSAFETGGGDSALASVPAAATRVLDLTEGLANSR